MNMALEEIQLKNLKLKNRIVRSATMDPFGNLDGTVSEEQLKLHETLAGNAIGLIIAAMSYVTPAGKVAAEQNSISDDGVIDSHRRLVDTVHRAPTDAGVPSGRQHLPVRHRHRRRAAPGPRAWQLPQMFMIQ